MNAKLSMHVFKDVSQVRVALQGLSTLWLHTLKTVNISTMEFCSLEEGALFR